MNLNVNVDVLNGLKILAIAFNKFEYSIKQVSVGGHERECFIVGC